MKKKLMIAGLLIASPSFVSAGLLDRISNKVENRVSQKIEDKAVKTAEDATDRVLDGDVGGASDTGSAPRRSNSFSRTRSSKSYSLGSGLGEPTRMFSLEQGATAEDGAVFIDLYDSVKYNRQVRAGIWGGEVIVSHSGIGYKHSVMPDLAVYGVVGLDTSDGVDSSFFAGASYSLMLVNDFSVTANVELGSFAGEFDFNVGAGAYFDLPNAGDLNQIKLGGELLLSSADNSDAGIQLGARWMPRDNIVIDLLAFNKSVLKGADGVFKTPAGIRVNLAF